MKEHYYPNAYTTNRTTACGRNGYETGGLIASFFKLMKSDDRCKVCNKRFKKDQCEKKTNQTPKIQ